MRRLHRQKGAGTFAHKTVDAGWDGLRELAQIDSVRGTPLTMNQRPPRPVLVCCALWCLAACANTTAGTDGGAVDAASEGAVIDAGVDAPPPALWPQPDPAAPRLIAPLSCTWHSSRRPTLRWALPPGVERVVVEVCADRPCQRVEHTLEVSGDSVRVPEELRPGAHFWRAFALVDGRRGAGSFTWGFRAPFRSAPNDLALGTYVDVNGDGYGDVVGITPGPTNPVHVFFGGPQGPGPRYDQRIEASGGVRETGDLNGDGFSDVLAVRVDDRAQPAIQLLEVHLGSPSGLRATRTLFPRQMPAEVGSSIVVSSLGDVNGDGYADLSHTPYSTRMLESARIYLGSPNGYEHANSFDVVPETAIPLYFKRVFPIGDFNGDSQPDFMVEGIQSWPDSFMPSSRRYYVVNAAQLRDPNRLGVRLQPPPTQWFNHPTMSNRLRYCDLNGDGRSEIYMRTWDGMRMTPLNIYTHREGAMSLMPSSTYSMGGSFFLELIGVDFDYNCAPDLDGDGFNDLILSAGLAPLNYVLFGSNSGPGLPVRFGTGVVVVGSEQDRSSRETANDVNGDGRSECAILDTTREGLLIYSGRGHDVAPEEQYRINVSTPTGGRGLRKLSILR